METRIGTKMMIACFVAMLAFAPATLLAGGQTAKKAEGTATTSAEKAKKDTMKSSDKKEKEDAAKKQAK